MSQKFSNNAPAKLASAVAPGDTSLSVVAGQGAEFPTLSGSDFFIATLQSADGSTIEIVKVTARSTDTFTVTRAQEGTTAGTFAAGDQCDLRLTAGGMGRFPQATLDTDGTLAADSDTNVASQKATKTYVDTGLALKAPLASPALTGTPTAPTATGGTNTTQLATTAFVQAAVGGVSVPVTSVFGRTGAVVKNSGDYAVADVTGAAPLASPALTGTPTAPTAAGGTNTTQIATTAFVQSAVSGASASISRATVTKTTASLANGAIENGTVTLAKWGHIGPIEVDRDCWIRLYATAADRTADASRAIGTPAAATTNLLAEWSFASGVVGGNDQTLRRLGVDYFNDDGTVTSDIYYAIANRCGATSTVQVKFTHLALET